MQLARGQRLRPPALITAALELPPDHVGTAYAAARLGVSERTVRRMCERGQLPGAFRYAHAGTWLIPRATLDAITDPEKRK